MSIIKFPNESHNEELRTVRPDGFIKPRDDDPRLKGMTDYLTTYDPETKKWYYIAECINCDCDVFEYDGINPICPQCGQVGFTDDDLVYDYLKQNGLLQDSDFKESN